MGRDRDNKKRVEIEKEGDSESEADSNSAAGMLKMTGIWVDAKTRDELKERARKKKYTL